ncbi:MAG: structural protein P5 [Alistipes sp.]|nr:structural protein P5 [Alistipes sp.]
MSRGMRNNNPGNIRLSATRFKGEVVPSKDSAFKQFSAVEYGYRAIFVLLDTYARRYGLTTIRKMISRYAPPTENFTDGYVRFVCRRSGIGADERVDSRSPRDMVPIVAAMAEIENGENPSIDDIHRGWNLFARDRGAVAVE